MSILKKIVYQAEMKTNAGNERQPTGTAESSSKHPEYLRPVVSAISCYNDVFTSSSENQGHEILMKVYDKLEIYGVVGYAGLNQDLLSVHCV